VSGSLRVDRPALGGVSRAETHSIPIRVAPIAASRNLLNAVLAVEVVYRLPRLLHSQ
jgi:hypothetical protein